MTTAEDGAGRPAFLCGLADVRLVTSDRHYGLHDAITAVLPGISWWRWRAHYARNLATKGASYRRSTSSPKAMMLTSAIHTKIESSLIIQLSCGNTLKSPLGARTFWVRATASVSAGQPQCTVKIVTNGG